MYICFSGGKLCNAIKEELKIASRFRFKKLDWCSLYAANCVHSPCFVLLLCLFVCEFVIYYILKFFLCEFLCAFVYI